MQHSSSEKTKYVAHPSLEEVLTELETAVSRKKGSLTSSLKSHQNSLDYDECISAHFLARGLATSEAFSESLLQLSSRDILALAKGPLSILPQLPETLAVSYMALMLMLANVRASRPTPLCCAGLSLRETGLGLMNLGYPQYAAGMLTVAGTMLPSSVGTETRRRALLCFVRIQDPRSALTLTDSITDNFERAVVRVMLMLCMGDWRGAAMDASKLDEDHPEYHEAATLLMELTETVRAHGDDLTVAHLLPYASALRDIVVSEIGTATLEQLLTAQFCF